MPQSQLAPVAHRLLQLAGHEPSDEQLLEAYRRSRDEQAFAALVRRHGPLVMGVCRRALGHDQDAEDAFQATFLVLARCASSIRRHDSLPAWLHRVSCRIARSARETLARRRFKEQQAARRESAPAGDELTWREVRGLLDEEVARLPNAYRDVFVLCCLQERSKPEAARLLGLKEGTVSSRLARAKKRLHEALTHRGVALSAALAMLSLDGTGRNLSAAFIKAAAVGCCRGDMAARIVTLADGAASAVVGTKAKVALALAALAVTLLAPLAAGSKPEAQAREMRPLAGASGSGTEERPTPKENTVTGVVLNPDGKPVPGANVTARVSSPGRHAGGMAAATTTDAAGRFRLTFRQAEPGRVRVVATAPGFGPDWAVPGDKSLTLTLPRDQAVTGKVVDLEGRPVKNAWVRVIQVSAPETGDLAAEFAGHERRKSRYRRLHEEFIPESLRTFASDDKGQLRLAGLGRERLVTAVIEGPTIASQEVWILSRTAAVPKPRGYAELTIHLASFTHVAAPTRPVVGVVRDRATKRPLAGVRVWAMQAGSQTGIIPTHIATYTDAAGNYRLIGLPKGPGSVVAVEPTADQPYLGVRFGVPDPVGGEPVVANVELRRGLWVEGRVTVKETGEPVPYATVSYFPRAGNPQVPAVVGMSNAQFVNTERLAGADGRFRVAVLPDHGAVAVRGPAEFLLLREQRGPDGDTRAANALPYDLPHDTFHSFAAIHPADGTECVRCDVALSKGEAIQGTLLDPQGKPVSGAWAWGRKSGWTMWEGPLPSANFTLAAFNRELPRFVAFSHPERNLAGVLRSPLPKQGPVTVELQKGCVITGTLVDHDGKPRAGVTLWLTADLSRVGELGGYEFVNSRSQTGADGKFRFAGLLPDLEYLVSTRGGRVGTWWYYLKAGEAKDLGKVQVFGR